ncbi:MAG: serralysin [Sphingomonadales bacterium]|jgi:Ca2+-binding RTX toxin-like protein|nr:serralysin [Sphingomonadales bacterium]
MSIARSRSAYLSDSRASFAQADQVSASAFSLTSGMYDGYLKLTTARIGQPADAIGDVHPHVPNAVFVVTPDEAGDGKGLPPGNPILTVDAAHTIGTLNTIGDQDFYQVTLTAGQTYQIGMYGYTGGPSGTPNPDSYVEVYANDGTTLLASGDGGATTPANNVNSGFDVLMTFTPTTTGTYYINARAFDQDATNGTKGDTVGDYELFVHDATNDPNVYHPYYNDSSPLYAIDWGTRVNKVDQTAANPDGNEGPRPTGNAQGTPTYGAYDMNAVLLANGKTAADIVGKNVITIYFAKAGEIITSVENPASPGLPPAAVETSDVSDFEHNAVMTALHQFELVADVVYLEVQDKSQADFEYASYKGTPGPGISLLGSMEPPDEPNEGLALFNSGDYRWNATDLQQGGFSFVTLIHEIGHGHGLAHPHDNGGHSGIMHGVQPEGAGVADYTTGDYHLNQSVFTMMSYEDGWQDSPYGNAPTTGGYGYLGGLMAFDIAAIQDKYGVNEDTATGDDVYLIKDVNAPGTYYTSIWDAGGNDEIKYVGTKDANIDLRPATLKYEWGGGGWVSYAYGIYGGYTVANGVTIEKATTDAGKDTIHDNAADNILSSGANDDLVYANQGGNDVVNLGSGNDAAIFGAAYTAGDSVDGGEGNDQVGLQGDYSGGVTLGTLAGVETLVAISGSDTRFGDSGTSLYSYNIVSPDATVAAGTQLMVNASMLEAGENLTFDGHAETDGIFFIYGGKGVDTLTGGAGGDVFFFAEDGRFAATDHVDGGGGSDEMVLRGNYSLTLSGSSIVNVETVVLLSGSDARFYAAGTPFSYDIATADDTVAAGQTMTFNGARLNANETMHFDGSLETNGNFRLFAGSADDVIRGGAGNDLIYGGLGADTLAGGGGNDVFRYQGATESTTNGRDGIQDFSLGDLIDLSRVDADSIHDGQQHFTWIEGNFTGHAGELHATQDSPQGPIWTISGDTDGDGQADFQISVVVTDAHPITNTDFIL